MTDGPTAPTAGQWVDRRGRRAPAPGQLLLQGVQVVVDGEARDAQHLGDVLHRPAQGERAQLVEAAHQLLLLLTIELGRGGPDLPLDGGDHAVEGAVEARHAEAPDQLALPPQLDVAGLDLGGGDDAGPDRVGHRLHGGQQRMAAGAGHRREATEPRTAPTGRRHAIMGRWPTTTIWRTGSGS